MTIGERIKELRETLHLSQEEFAQKIFRVKSTISQIESDKSALSPSLRMAICHTFNVREEWILTGEGGRGVLFIDITSKNTGVAVEHVLAMLPQIKIGVEVIYSEGLREKAVSHILLFANEEIQLVYSELNMDRRPRQLEVDEIRSAFKTNGKPLLTYQLSSVEIAELVTHPSHEKLKNIIDRSTTNSSSLSGAHTDVYTQESKSFAAPPRHPAAALMPVPDVNNSGIDPAIQAMSDIKEIFDSGDPILIPAIQANLHAFKRALLRERQFAQVLEENKDLRNRMQNLEDLCKDIPDLKNQFENLKTENRALRTENNRLKSTYEAPDGSDGSVTAATEKKAI